MKEVKATKEQSIGVGSWVVIKGCDVTERFYGLADNMKSFIGHRYCVASRRGVSVEFNEGPWSWHVDDLVLVDLEEDTEDSQDNQDLYLTFKTYIGSLISKGKLHLPYQSEIEDWYDNESDSFVTPSLQNRYEVWKHLKGGSA